MAAGTGQQTIRSKPDVRKQPTTENQPCSSPEADWQLNESQKTKAEIVESTNSKRAAKKQRETEPLQQDEPFNSE